MACDFSSVRYSSKTIKEYREQTVSGTIVRFKAYDGKHLDLHEHILRDIDSFRDLIDREMKTREENFKNSSGLETKEDYIAQMKMPIIIEFKNYNIEIMQVK